MKVMITLKGFKATFPFAYSFYPRNYCIEGTVLAALHNSNKTDVHITFFLYESVIQFTNLECVLRNGQELLVCLAEVHAG